MAKLVAVNWRDMKNPEAGGAEVHLHEILTRLVANGHDVTLFASNFPGGAPEDAYDGLRIIRAGNWYNANFVIPMRVRSWLRQNPCDLVIEDINKIPFFLPLVTKVPVLAVIPHLFGTTVFDETNPIFASYVYLWELFIPWVYRRCRFAVISPSTKDDLVDRRIKPDMIDVVYCGLDHGTYRTLENVERFEHPTLIHFGRIRKYKAVDVVVRAFGIVRDTYPDAELLIVGGGPDRPALEKLVERDGYGGSVKFLGYVETEEMVRILNRTHLFLNASAKEGWGLTVVEANACGVPVVASNRPGLKDSVLDGKTGYLVEHGNPQAFADKSIELLRDPAKWRQMHDAAVEWAQSFSWDRTAEEMERIILAEIAKGAQ